MIPTCTRKLSLSCRRHFSLSFHYSSHPKCIFICISFILQTFQEKVSKYKIVCFVLFFFTFHKLLLLFSAKFLSFIFQLNFIIIAVLLLWTTVFTNKNYFFYKLIVFRIFSFSNLCQIQLTFMSHAYFKIYQFMGCVEILQRISLVH